ncbi:hypothetical protein M0R45_019836 [Rubus argutus]|uniref:Uncharacterized protein n=1 Tax=Rubus argutus TaxID=59490 RepID=A0AAW1X924_RUBAR
MEEALDAAGALKLVMLKGPREGETLEYPPGSELRIGRLVRGQQLQPSKTPHLHPSPNHRLPLRQMAAPRPPLLHGTIVHHTNLRPDTPLELNDGDRIKIGEYTSIEVKIDHDHSRLRRNPRRGAAATKPGSVAKKNEVKAGLRNLRSWRIEGLAGRGKLGFLRSEQVVVPQVSSRLTRRSKDVGADSALAEIPENCSEEEDVPEEKDLGEIVVVDVKDDDDRGDQKYLGGIARAEVKDSGDDGEEGAVNVNDVDENGSGCGVKESKVGQELDSEKMTLDDWFDYVQVSWPKVVVHEIDKICDEMREKAKQVQEYIAQHQKEKVQG